MEYTIYQIDTFTDTLFKGNPAAVCPLTEWLPEQKMQQIALENNLSETAFYVKNGKHYDIRWFTPTTEVDLCGHATLATAYVEFFLLNNPVKELIFKAKGGTLKTKLAGEYIQIDFPTDTIQEIELKAEHVAPFAVKPLAAFKGKSDLMLVFSSEEEIRKMNPDLSLVKKLPVRGIIVTAPGETVDFVSRFFGPQSGIDEDPVTGSAHTTLTPYWAKKLGKQKLQAKQVSSRGGDLLCEIADDRIILKGKAVQYMKAQIFMP